MSIQDQPVQFHGRVPLRMELKHISGVRGVVFLIVIEPTTNRGEKIHGAGRPEALLSLLEVADPTPQKLRVPGKCL